MQTCLREKQAESREIAKHLAEFEAKGGKVKRCKAGESGIKPLRYVRKNNRGSLL